jgi:hypothetical protein
MVSWGDVGNIYPRVEKHSSSTNAASLGEWPLDSTNGDAKEPRIYNFTFIGRIRWYTYADCQIGRDLFHSEERIVTPAPREARSSRGTRVATFEE